MGKRTGSTLALGIAALAITALVIGCGRGERAAGKHPETFEAAKALAAKRQVPVLVDFYSPT